MMFTIEFENLKYTIKRNSFRYILLPILHDTLSPEVYQITYNIFV